MDVEKENASIVIHYNQRLSILLNNPYGDSLMDTQNNNTSLLNDKNGGHEIYYWIYRVNG